MLNAHTQKTCNGKRTAQRLRSNAVLDGLSIHIASCHPYMTISKNQTKRCIQQITPFPHPMPLHRCRCFHAGLRRANSSRSVLVATPKTNLLLSSVTTANSCFPFSPFSPPLKNSSNSSSGVSMVITLYTLPFLRNLTIALLTSSVSCTLWLSRRMRRCGIDRYPSRALVEDETTVRCV